MTDFPPYLNGYGFIEKVLVAMLSAKVPPKFTQSFLTSKLGIKSNSARPIIPFLKRIGFLNDGGVPTNRYEKYRNQMESGRAIAEGLKEGYSILYETNEYAHDLSDSELEGLFLQVTNEEKGQKIKSAVKSFLALKSLADFSDSEASFSAVDSAVHKEATLAIPEPSRSQNNMPVRSHSKMNLSYTINLNLPETSNPEVFDAIFQSLNRNILKEHE